MLALHGLQQEKAELVFYVMRVEEGDRRLVEMHQEATKHRVAAFNDFVKRRGLELQRHGKFLVSIADAKTESSSL